MKAALFLNRHASFLLLLTLVGMQAVGVVVAKETPVAYLPDQLTLGGRVGDDPEEFIADVLLPLITSDSGLVFVNPRVNVSDSDEEEFNLGVGYRQLIGEGRAIVGANTYWDSRWTERNNRFDQIGFGLEWLTKFFDARANVYLAMDEEKRYDSFESESVVSTRTRSAGFGDPYPDEHRIVQSSRTTTTTTTRHEAFGLYEVPLEGYDIEVGGWVPLPKHCPAELGLFVSYYNFDEDFGGGDIDGLKGRLELRALPGLVLDAEIYGDDDLNGTEYFVGGRLQLPLDLTGIISGRNPFAVTGPEMAMEKRSFGHRLVENVIRDPHVQVSDELRKDSEEFVDTTTSSTDVHVLVDDVQFVHNGNTSGVEDGSAERPQSTIQAAVDKAYGEKNVYVFASGQDYQENVILSEGVSLFGQGGVIVGVGGRVFGGDARPTVDGGSRGPSITVADNTTVRGMHVINTDLGGPSQMVGINGDVFDIRRAGIFGHNANNVAITRNNLIEANEYGVLLLADSVEHFQARLRGNTIRENSKDGVNVQGTGMSGTFTFVSRNNDYSNNRDDGVAIAANNYDLVRLCFMCDTASDNDGDGLDFSDSDGNDRLVVSLRHVTAEHNGPDLPRIGPPNGPPGNTVTVLSAPVPQLNGIVAPRSGHGVEMSHLSVGPGGLKVTVAGGSFSGNSGSGIKIEVAGEGPVRGAFTRVTASDNAENGIALLAASGVFAQGPQVVANGPAARAVPAGGDIDLAFRDVHANNNGLGGKLPNPGVASEADQAQGTVSGPLVQVPTGNGILVMAASTGPLAVTFDGIRAHDNGAAGVASLLYTESADNTATFKDVAANGNGIGIISLQGASEASASVRFSDVRTMGNFGPGVGAFAVATDASTLSFVNVTSSLNDGPGIWIEDVLGRGESGNLYIYGSGNVLRDNRAAGIHIRHGEPEGDAIIDFGGGELGSPGRNTITGNGAVGFFNDTGIEALAQINFWGNVPPVSGLDYSADVDASDHLGADPNL